MDALREEGQAVVTDVVAIFTYELYAASEAAQEHRLKFHPLATLGMLLTVAAEQGEIDQMR